MSHYTATFQETAIALDRIIATVLRIEPIIYRADDWFQEHIVSHAKYYAIVVVAEFARAAYIVFVAGQNASAWYQRWFCQYVAGAVPAIVEEPQSLLCGVAYAGYLMPASEAEKVLGKPVRKPKTKSRAK